MNERQVLAKMNDVLASSSKGFQEDLIDLRKFMAQLELCDFSDDNQLALQFEICAMMTAFLSLATLYPEDFNDIVTWWNEHIAKVVLKSRTEDRHGN